MRLKLSVLIIMFLSCKMFSQNFWEYIGLGGFFIANITQDNTGRYYATEWLGTGDSVFFSDDLGKTWNSYGEVNDSIFVNISSILFLNNNDLFISAWGDSTSGGIYKSIDGSKTWERKSVGVSTTKVLKSTDTLFGSLFDAIHISTDKGESWAEIGSKPDPGNEIVDIAMSNDGKLFAITFAEVFRSTNNGLTWELVNNGIPSTTNFFVNLTLSDAGYLYLGTRRLGIYRSSDCGENWEYKRHGWIRYVTTKTGGHVMAGAEQEGLIISSDHGDTWEIINSGLPNSTFINSVYFDKDGYAYCSVHNFGIYKSALPVSVDEVENNNDLSSYILYQNYPNPFNSQTNIEFEIKEKSFVGLKVFDILGREVNTLINQEIAPGKYLVEFKAEDLSSGNYFYQFIVNDLPINIGSDFNQTRKMILIK